MKQPPTVESHTFNSTITKTFLKLVFLAISFIIFFIGYGILNFRLLQLFALIPIGIGMLLVIILGLIAGSCLNKSVTIDKSTIIYKTGNKKLIILCKDLRDIHLRRHFLYNQLRIGDGMKSFTIMDISFQQLYKIRDLAFSIKELRTTQAQEFSV